MSRESRQQSLRQSKERRQKLIAVGGAVVLAVVLAVELPSVLGGGSNSAAPPATTGTATTSTTAATGSTTTTTATSAVAAGMPAAPTRLANSDPSPRRTKSQLSSFSQFESKDPFVQQVSDQPATPSVPKPSAAKGSASVPNTSAGSGSGSSPVQQTSARTLAQLGAATIAVNGKSETVRVGASFPSSNPIFTLVSLTKSGAQIGIANGSYTSGAQTVSLTTGKSLTLVDTADGVRYELRLLSVS